MRRGAATVPRLKDGPKLPCSAVALPVHVLAARRHLDPLPVEGLDLATRMATARATAYPVGAHCFYTTRPAGAKRCRGTRNVRGGGAPSNDGSCSGTPLVGAPAPAPPSTSVGSGPASVAPDAERGQDAPPGAAARVCVSSSGPTVTLGVCTDSGASHPASLNRVDTVAAVRNILGISGPCGTCAVTVATGAAVKRRRTLEEH